MKNYLKKNFVSFLIGCILGIPFSIYAENHREPATIPVYYDPRLFEQFTEHESELNEKKTCEVQEDDLEEELYYDSLELMAFCVEAEAGNQDLYGKRLVVDVILNRVDSPNFPDNITDVIMQENQFSVVLDGRIWTVEPSEETFEAVRLELESRTNTEVIFFTSEGFSRYGVAWEKVGDHYFSTERR